VIWYSIGIKVQERVERTREAPKFPLLMSYLRPKGAGWRRYDGYIEWMMVAIEAFRDHDRYAGADVLNTPDKDDGQMEVAGIGEDADPELCSFAKPRHPPILVELCLFRDHGHGGRNDYRSSGAIASSSQSNFPIVISILELNYKVCRRPPDAPR
jgi:hypothetical protein